MKIYRRLKIFVGHLVRNSPRLKRFIVRLLRNTPPSVANYISGQENENIPEIQRGPLIGGDWDEFVEIIVTEFKNAPMSFLRQPVISRTVHPNQQELARNYLNDLCDNLFSRTNILPRLHDLPIGDPYLCEFFPFASPSSMQHAYFLSLMKEHLNIFLPQNDVSHVLEIGGGYGNFCRLACAFGYSGRYIIADLPEIHGIQRHYLSYALPDQIIEEQIEFRFLGDPEILPRHRPSLLIATFSLSEMPLNIRALLEPNYEHFNYIFIAFNRAFGDVDNCEYFEQLANSLMKKFSVRLIKDRHRMAWFLLCKRNDAEVIV